MIADDTIVALATPQGVGAIAMIRVSGKDAIQLTNKVFSGKNLEEQHSHTIHFGTIKDKDKIIDEVLVSVFKEPNSFTKENLVEISCHGSMLVAREIIECLLKNGARLAQPGEFTKRAFMYGRFDLAQAEAVADIINAETEAGKQSALNQMRGGFSNQIKTLKDELVHFASMIELELDFSEEDVEFANRDELKKLVTALNKKILELADSFKLGNVIKNGIPTVIAGKPNAGKSTLLNALLQEEKAIVTEIPGTTRDLIEDELNIEGIMFRFIDTAGLREADNEVEAIGVQRTRDKMEQAALLLYLFDLESEDFDSIKSEIEKLGKSHTAYLAIGNKMDLVAESLINELNGIKDLILISAKNNQNLEDLKKKILEKVNIDLSQTGDALVTNIRHQQSLVSTSESLENVVRGIDSNLTNDLLAQEIRHALHSLGEITGEITTDDLLENIFSKFCIGK